MTTLQVSAQQQLRQLVEKIERIEEEIAERKEDHKGVYAEAKGVGFDVKILRKIIARRKRSKSDLQEEDAIMATYMHALGMAGTPMGDYLDQQEHDEVAA